MAKMVMIADDLTGAADCAAACAAHGVSATVVLHAPRHSAPCWPDTDILSIDADTRCLSSAQAAAATSDLLRICQTRGAFDAPCLLFKKLDSTLRGNMATELAAILRMRRSLVSGNEKIAMIMAPALPAQGRTTIGGRQFVHGRPLHETDLWKDETHAPQSKISALLAEAGLSCCVIEIATVRRSLSALQNAMAKLVREADVVLCDAETDDDLRAIAEASILLGEGTVWAGSAGLASHLPHAAGFVGTSSAAPVNFAVGPSLFVVGSGASVTREQASVLAAIPNVFTVRVAPAMLLNSQAAALPILKGLQSNRDVLVLLDGSERCTANETRILTQALSKLIAPCAPLLGGLVATGGETARAILDDLGIQSLRLLGEVEPGLPFSIADKWPQFPVLTKAGAFGTPQALVRCREFLQKLERTSARSEAKRPTVSRES